MEHYALAIRTMQSRPDSDPTSWDRQARIHGDSCQHANWHFLGWHRMYLHRYEAIVRAAVIANGGPTDWALPFWDYEHNATIPWVFRQPTMADGSPNPLFISNRNSRLANGNPMSAGETNWAQARAATIFTAGSPAQISISFAGPPTGAAFFGRGFGALEQQPHNVVHVAVGGPMGQVPLAGFDPLFWLHHANIDRLWELWNREGGLNSTDPAYLNQSFAFFDVDQSQVTDTNAQVNDIEGSLGYTYEGLPPFGPPPVGFDEDTGGPSVPAEMIGASAEALTLTTGVASAEVTLEAPAGPGLVGGETDDAPARVYLVLDNVSGDDAPAVNYEVILDMGTDEDPSDDFVVGVAGFFGVVEAAAVDNDDAPHGLTLTYDVTAVVDRLRARGVWDDQRARVSFRALDDADTPPISVGGIRLFVE